MPIAVSTITPDKAALILKRSEGQFCDMKARDIAPGKLSRTLSALANADGGEIFVGIGGPKEGPFAWSGFANEEDANGHLLLVDELFPLGTVTRCQFLACQAEPGLLLHIEVEKTGDIRPASDGIAYLRRGAQNLPQNTSDKLDRLRLDKGIKSHEDYTLATEPSDITNSLAIIDFMLDVVPSAEPEIWLRKQKLIVQDKPTVAGALLFSDEPQVDLPKAAIKIYRYKTIDQAGTRATLAFDPVSIDGNLYKQIFSAVNKIKEITEEIPLLGSEGLEKIEYPTEAIHEVVTNA
jgi:ATP-dependent DNA helicase RecG